MEEEEDKDDKKDQMERQCKAAEKSQQEEVSTPGVRSGTSEDTDNKEAQVLGSEVFQTSSKIKLQAENENGVNAIEESSTQRSDSAQKADESSLNAGADDQEYLSRSDRSVEKENTEAAVLEEKCRYEKRNNIETLERDSSSENSQISKFQSTTSPNKNVPKQLQQPQDSDENELISGNLRSQVPESLASKITKDQVQLEEKDKKVVIKTELKSCSSPKKQLKQTALGDIREKQMNAHESKQGGSQPLCQRQSYVSKGQKSVETVRRTGRETDQKEGKEKTYNKLHTKQQGLQSTSEANKMQQKRGGSDQEKLKAEEKQVAQVKEGRKQPKQAATKTTDKREQKCPAVQKELQNVPLKKTSVRKKEPTVSSPKRNALLKEKQTNLQRKVKQKMSNTNVVQNKELKGIGQLQPAEGSLLGAKDQQDPTLPVPVELQGTAEKTTSKENIGSLCKPQKESGKELLNGLKKQEDQPQGTNKLSEKKSQQEKQNEIQKQKEQNKDNQQLKQQKKESYQCVDQENKIPQKFAQSTKASVPLKKEESSVPTALKKQASKSNKELKDIQKSTQQNRETNATQQLAKVSKKSSQEQKVQTPACLKEGKEREKPSKHTHEAMVGKSSDKNDSSENIIHSIRRQYQQLRKEDSLQQHLLDRSPHSHQPVEKEEKVQQQQQPEARSDENKVETKEELNHLAQNKYADYEDDKSMGCGGMQGSSCPIYFGVKSYLHHFYDTTPVKNPQLYEEYTEEDDFEYTVDPVKSRGCRKCCQGFWFRAGLWGGINLILVGVITFLVGYFTPQREVIVGQQGDLEILDRSAIVFNHRLELCRLAGLAVFCCGGMVLFVVLFISTLLHVRGHNNESMCCTENVYYGYTTAPLVEPFIVAQTHELTMPSTTGIKIPIIEEIKPVQPIIWPEMGTVKEGSRVGQMP